MRLRLFLYSGHLLYLLLYNIYILLDDLRRCPCITSIPTKQAEVEIVSDFDAPENLSIQTHSRKIFSLINSLSLCYSPRAFLSCLISQKDGIELHSDSVVPWEVEGEKNDIIRLYVSNVSVIILDSLVRNMCLWLSWQFFMLNYNLQTYILPLYILCIKVCVCACVHAHTCHSTYVTIRSYLSVVGTVFI